MVIAGALHWAFPTRYPRELFPIPEGTDPLSAGMLQVVRFFDTPSSCLPSLHVAISFASALLVWRERKRIFWALLAWSLVIAASTLTTKQHYLIDVLSGALLAVLVTFAVDARAWWVARAAA